MLKISTASWIMAVSLIKMMLFVCHLVILMLMFAGKLIADVDESDDTMFCMVWACLSAMITSHFIRCGLQLTGVASMGEWHRLKG